MGAANQPEEGDSLVGLFTEVEQCGQRSFIVDFVCEQVNAFRFA